MTLAVDHAVPGTKDLAPRKRVKVVTLVAIGMVALAVGGLSGSFIFDIKTTKSRMAADQNAEDELDEEEQPFTASTEYDRSLPENGKIVLDRALTKREQEKLTSILVRSAREGNGPNSVWNFMKPLGGRLLRYPPLLEQALDAYNTAPGTDSTIFKMNLFSNRKADLSIVDMRAVHISCREPTAKTVIDWPPQGGVAYEGVLYDLTQHNFEPIITDEGDRQGEPYFSRGKINLGNSESPGGLRVDAVVRGQSCDWEIKAKYSDAYKKSGTVILKDGKKPFFSEATPTDPEQLWLLNAAGRPIEQPWVACHEMPDDMNCRAWREERATSNRE